VVTATLQESERDGFEVRDEGIYNGHVIYRKVDNQMVEKNILSGDEAWRRVRTQHIPNRNAEAMLQRR
jgi:hypothetical protein